MINQETKLKLQAHLDHELSAAESRRMGALLDQDPEARALFAELTGLRSALKGNELELKLPETREFYWSKIERAIAQSARQESRVPARRSWWLRIMAPAIGVALLMSALVLVKLSSTPPAVSYLHEIDTPLQDTSTISFHSQAAGMSVVWVQTQVY